MELPVAALERLCHPLYGIHDIKARHQVHVHPGGVAYETQNGLILALGDMDSQPQVLKPVDKLVPLFLGHTVFKHYNHFPVLLLMVE